MYHFQDAFFILKDFTFSYQAYHKNKAEAVSK